MKTITIEQAFGAAARFAESMVGRGFQAKVSALADVDSSNLNSIIKKDKGASEKVRRDIFAAIVQVAEQLPVENYEDFLLLGQWIAEGKEPRAWGSTTTTDSPTTTAGRDAVVVSNSRHVDIGPPERRQRRDHEVVMDDAVWSLWQLFQLVPDHHRAGLLRDCRERLVGFIGIVAPDRLPGTRA